MLSEYYGSEFLNDIASFSPAPIIVTHIFTTLNSYTYINYA